MKNLESIAKAAGVSVIGLIIGIIALIITGLWIVFVPILLILLVYILIDSFIDNKIFSALLSYYFNSVIMSIIALLLYYLPSVFGGGLFEAGYLLADFITMTSIIDWIFNIQTDAWGIYYNWGITVSFLVIIIGFIVYEVKK